MQFRDPDPLRSQAFMGGMTGAVGRIDRTKVAGRVRMMPRLEP